MPQRRLPPPRVVKDYYGVIAKDASSCAVTYVSLASSRKQKAVVALLRVWAKIRTHQVQQIVFLFENPGSQWAHGEATLLCQGLGGFGWVPKSYLSSNNSQVLASSR